MGYIIGLVIIVLLVPLIFLLATRRTTTGNGTVEPGNRGVTPDRPSSDQPRPPVNREGRTPPG